jgi:hypothetical protein
MIECGKVLGVEIGFLGALFGVVHFTCFVLPRVAKRIWRYEQFLRSGRKAP